MNPFTNHHGLKVLAQKILYDYNVHDTIVLYLLRRLRTNFSRHYWS